MAFFCMERPPGRKRPCSISSSRCSAWLQHLCMYTSTMGPNPTWNHHIAQFCLFDLGFGRFGCFGGFRNKILFLRQKGHLRGNDIAAFPPVAVQHGYNIYCKVASCIPVYYSIFDHILGATNQDMLLSKTCYYCYVQGNGSNLIQKLSIFPTRM